MSVLYHGSGPRYRFLLSQSTSPPCLRNAEAGYQISKAAYEQMIKDIAGLKAEVRLMWQMVVTSIATPGLDMLDASETYSDKEEDETDEWPADLEAAQQILE